MTRVTAMTTCAVVQVEHTIDSRDLDQLGEWREAGYPYEYVA